MQRLTADQARVLEWIGNEDLAPIGPVEGDAFRSLVAMGAAEIQGEGTHLTEYGWELLGDMKSESRDAEAIASMSWTD